MMWLVHLWLALATPGHAEPYAIVVSEKTLGMPEWAQVVEALKAKYKGKVFTYRTLVAEVKDSLRAFRPKYVCFVLRPPSEVRNYVGISINRLTRELDDDPYGDAIWGIVTGYTPEDALRLVSIDGFRVRKVLAGTSAGWLEYVREGIATSETTYGKMWVKLPDGAIVDTTCPTDRTKFLIDLLNTNEFDMFITSGHGNVDMWQLHYPEPGLEGFFRSKEGRVYGDPYEGPDVYLNSTNPKIYFGLGNCYIGMIKDMNSMALAWIHSGGAYMYTGYIMPEGPDSYQLGGIPGYFFVQDHYTWPEAFFANNQALLFDLKNDTPGTDPPDLDGAVLYGDPALDVRVDPVREPLYRKEIHIARGEERDTVTVKIVMNEEGKPGFTGKWGNRHPVILLPFRAEDPRLIYTDAYKAVVTDNFVLMYIWKMGDPPLEAGEGREVVFTCLKVPTELDVAEEGSELPGPGMALEVHPNPFWGRSLLRYKLPAGIYASLHIYDITGRIVRRLYEGRGPSGWHTLSWDGRDDFGRKVASGVYICRLVAGKSACAKRIVFLR